MLLAVAGSRSVPVGCTLAKRVDHIASTSSTFAALMRVCSLSGCGRSVSATHDQVAYPVAATYRNVDIVICENESGV